MAGLHSIGRRRDGLSARPVFRRRLSGLAAVLGVWLWGAAGAVAGGSLPFGEVMAFLRGHPELAQRLDALVVQEKIDPAELVCVGIRLGNQWQHLGGQRVLPFECEVGSRTVVIEGVVEFLDRKGRVIATVADGDDSQITKSVFRNAKEVRMSNPRLKME
ncbi:MAG: hypothetical protein HC900_01020 [Methylacidiphilales bacterium]|nr:hypothetical protein [Candidatus Methylacidiphilales bacterium]